MIHISGHSPDYEVAPFTDLPEPLSCGIESLNARYGGAVTAKGHFPSEQAALKTLYLVTRCLDPKGTGRVRWITRWKLALNAFSITYADRMPAAEHL